MSPLTATADLRWLRAGVAAAVAVAIGAGAHASAGGLLPDVGGLALITGVLAVLFAAALGRPATYVMVAAMVAGGQFAVHLLLTMVSGHPGAHPEAAATPSGALPMAPRSSLDRLSELDTASAVESLPTPSGSPSLAHALAHVRDDLTGPSLLMALAHLGAAAALAAWLFVGEQALWTLVALLGARVLRPWLDLTGVIATRTDRSRPPAASDAVVPPLVSRLVSSGPLGRRGPPFLAPLPPHPPTT